MEPMTSERTTMSNSNKVGTDFPEIVNSESIKGDFPSGSVKDTIEVIPQSTNGEMEVSSLHANGELVCKEGSLPTDLAVKIEREDDEGETAGEVVWFSSGERQGEKTCQGVEQETKCESNQEESHCDVGTCFDNETSLIRTNNAVRKAEVEEESQNSYEMQRIDDDSKTVEHISVSVKVEDLFPSDSPELEAHSSSGHWQSESNDSGINDSLYLSENLQYEEETFQNVSESFTNHAENTPGVGPFQCEKCAMVFEDLFTLIVHLRTHNGGRILECTLCPAKLPGETNLRRHLKIHGDDKRFECEQCPAKFRLLVELQAHWRVHTGERPFKCEQCSETFMNRGALNGHVKRGHSERLGLFICVWCPASFKSMTRLTAHLLEHNGGKPHKCEVCPATFIRRSSLRKHIKDYHRKGSLQCPLCLASFKQEWALSEHLKTHEVPFFKCLACAASFKTQEDLEVHASAHSGGLPYVCKLCSAKFPAKYMLESHLEVHSGEKPFKCKLCPSGFTALNGLRKHLTSVHTDPRQFKCQWCPAYFKLKSALIVHWKVHGGERPYSCYYCRASCKNPSSLMMHLKLHRNENCSRVSGQALRQEELASSAASAAVDNLETDEALLDMLENLQNSDGEEEYDHSADSQTGCFKEESHSENFETCPDSNSSLISTDNKGEADETEEKPRNMSETQPKFSDDSENVEHINVAVKIEDMFPSDSLELDEADSNSQDDRASPDSQHLSEDCEMDEEPEFPENFSGFTNHSESQESGPNGFEPYQCEKCPTVCEDLYTLSVHLNTHTGGRILECPLCPAKAMGKVGLKLHLKVHGDDKRFECEQCPARFRKLQNFQIHLRTHSGEKPFECRQCSEKFVSRSSLNMHVKHKHTDGRRYFCPQCYVSFRFMSHLTAHLDEHNGAKPFKCEFCPSAFARSHHLWLHFKEVHAGSFKCELCLVTFDQASELDAHLKTHSSPFFKCLLCPASFKKRSYLKAHTEAHKDLLVSKCQVCSATFKNTFLLESHLKVHSGEYPFKCKLCSAGFPQIRALRSHLKIVHTEAREFKCPHCPAYFKLRSAKTAHLKIHFGERPFKCDYCPASFKNSSGLTCHLKVHSEEKPFKCIYCPASYKRSTCLKRHINAHNEEYLSVNSASQDLCEAGFASDSVENIEIKEELPGILETLQDSDTNDGEESEEVPMNFEVGGVKEETDFDNVETRIDVDMSSIPTDDTGMEETGEEPQNTFAPLLKIKTVEYINVSVKPEDIFPSDSQELGKTFSSDLQHQNLQNVQGPSQCEEGGPMICEDLRTDTH